MANDSSCGLAMKDFVHLNVASGFSLRYGSSSAQDLVQSAVESGMSALALTDRDGLYGAVRFIKACTAANISPIVGVSLAVRPAVQHSIPSPMFGGATVDAKAPRVILIPQGPGAVVGLNRAVSAFHDSGFDHQTMRRIVEIVDESDSRSRITVVLGPDSDVGRAVMARRRDQALLALAQWRATGARIVFEVVSHRVRDSQLSLTTVDHKSLESVSFSTNAAARMWKFADEQQLPAILTNAVRYCQPAQARIADVLDATRRLVPLSARHVDGSNAEAFLKSPNHMWQLAHEIADCAGYSPSDVTRLLDQTLTLAHESIVDPLLDFGIGSVHVPELDVILNPDYRTQGDVSWARPAAIRRTAAVIATEAAAADQVLRTRCDVALRDPKFANSFRTHDVRKRYEDELAVIAHLGFAGYFLTVAEVVTIARQRGIRVAARGSGAGSFVNHLLGISALNPLDHDLIMERFLSPLRSSLPDIDIDVESHRRLEIYDAVFQRFGQDRVACVSMMETYRVRHAVRDVGAALGLPKAEIDSFAKAFPHIRARDARKALQDLPELRRSGFGALARAGQLDEILELVEGLDRLPRHIAMHPCGILLSDSALLDRTPVQSSGAGYPMSHYDKDDVEELGFLKLDVLGIRMQSAMAHATAEIARTQNQIVELDTLPLDDAATFELIQSTKTLGCFQIESPGQRELIGKFGPSSFNDIIIDISLFRPGPVKSDMITPFLNVRHGWKNAEYFHPSLESILRPTSGVVVFHEQVIKIIAQLTGATLAQADEVRRGLGDWEQHTPLRAWFYVAALNLDYDLDVVDKVWEILRAFASFGFCKAHAGAFALPTYQSAWLKAHFPAAFYAGVLTHDPGMYPKRLILDDARQWGVPILGLDVNQSSRHYVVQRSDSDDEWGIRIPFAQVKGINDAEIDSLITAQPFSDINDVWHRAQVSRPIMERLVLAGGFDELHSIVAATQQSRTVTTRRDLLVHVAELDRWRGSTVANSDMLFDVGPSVLPLRTGLPEMDAAERVQSELEILGMDVSHHVMDFYEPFLNGMQVTRSRDLLTCRSQQEVLIAGVKVSTQTPPVRSGRRVIFLTLDDGSGPLDATFFEDAQGDYAHTLFSSWTLLVRGVIRRTGPRGVSIRATGCWELSEVRNVFDEAAFSAAGRNLAAGRAAVWNFIETHGNTATNSELAELVSPHESDTAVVAPRGHRQSRWAGASTGDAITPPTKLWHTSQGSPG